MDDKIARAFYHPLKNKRLKIVRLDLKVVYGYSAVHSREKPILRTNFLIETLGFCWSRFLLILDVVS